MAIFNDYVILMALMTAFTVGLRFVMRAVGLI